MPDEIENEQSTVEPVEDEDDEELEDEELEDDGDEGDDGDTSNPDDSLDGGSGADEGEQPKPEAVVPTGKALLELLAGDTDAQEELRNVMTGFLQEQQAQAASAADLAEWQSLIEKGDNEAIGQRVLTRLQEGAARQKVTDEILQEQFQPLYRQLFATDELKNLTAEEKLDLDPGKYSSDAAFLAKLVSTVTIKRAEAKFEEEVTKRIAARDEAAKNGATAGKVKRPGLGATPAVVAGSAPKRSAAERITAGLQKAMGLDSIDDDDD